ncbi:MAG TPA: response regulator, partial [Bryobacteraceae bacterium]|nr:response regulator [Bryobacteraceae bacterium]
MSRILLADDSPHAQRMGERILREEGYEVFTVTDGQAALDRLVEADPDVIFADVSMPNRTGYEICRLVKDDSKYRHVRVVLTAGLLEPFDESQASEVRCDGILKKPFESSVVLETIRPLIEAARKDRANPPQPSPGPIPIDLARTPAPIPMEVEPRPAPARETPVTPVETPSAVRVLHKPRLDSPPLDPVSHATPVRVVPEQPTTEVVTLNGDVQA